MESIKLFSIKLKNERYKLSLTINGTTFFIKEMTDIVYYYDNQKLENVVIKDDKKAIFERLNSFEELKTNKHFIVEETEL